MKTDVLLRSPVEFSRASLFSFYLLLIFASLLMNLHGAQAGSGQASRNVSERSSGPRGVRLSTGASGDEHDIILTVNTIDDTYDGSCDTSPGGCSLRDAISSASSGLNNFIKFNLGGGGHTIVLVQGSLNISGDMTIMGPEDNSLTVSGNNASTVFDIHAGTVTISHLIISNGFNSFSGGGVSINSGIVTLTNCTISHNSIQGPFIYYAGSFTNGPPALGAGIYNKSGTVTLTNCTVKDNSALAGAIVLYLTQYHAIAFQAALGGGIYNAGFMIINNSTIRDNHVDGGSNCGSGICNDTSGNMIITNGTMTRNDRYGRAIENLGGSVSLRNTIVAENERGDANGTFTSLGHNLISRNAAAEASFPAGQPNVNGDLVGTDSNPVFVRLGPLVDNGGPTLTHLLMPGSPAIDAGDDTVLDPPFSFLTDQRGRGFPRKVNSAVDIGAVEVNYSLIATSGTPQSTTVNTAFSTQLQATITESSRPMPGITLTFSAPTSGASGTFPNGNTAVTDINGKASLPFIANNNVGSYTIVASSTGLSPIVFSLTNLSMQTSATVISFDRSSYTVREDAGRLLLTVLRTGDTSAPATVDYATSDLTATDHADYNRLIGTLLFTAGESARTIPLLINQDAYLEGTEMLSVALSNSTGGAVLDAPVTATVFINDDDSTPPSVNPLDDTQAFVRQHYHDFLNREPDEQGLAYWTNEIAKCGADTACLNSRRLDVSAAFCLEREFQQTGFFIYRLQMAALGQPPTYMQYSIDHNQVRTGTKADRTAFVYWFVQQADFVRKYPAEQTGEQFLDALLANVQQSSGIDLTDKRLELRFAYISGNTQAESRALALSQLIEYPEYIKAEKNRAFVLAEYFSFLRRDPDEAGYQFWLNALKRKSPDESAAYRAMVCAFVTSREYQERFSSIVTHDNLECGP